MFGLLYGSKSSPSMKLNGSLSHATVFHHTLMTITMRSEYTAIFISLWENRKLMTLILQILLFGAYGAKHRGPVGPSSRTDLPTSCLPGLYGAQ